MKLNDKDKQYIRFLVDEIKLAQKYNDTDYRKATFRRIDNIPRETTIKMLSDLVEYFELEEAQDVRYDNSRDGEVLALKQDRDRLKAYIADFLSIMDDAGDYIDTSYERQKLSDLANRIREAE